MSRNIVTLRDYLRIVFRRKMAVFIPLAAGIVLAGPLCLIFPPKYLAEALVKRQDLAIINSTPETLISRQTPSVSLSTLRAEILAWRNLDRVIRQLNLEVDLKSPADWQAKYEELKTSIKLEPVAQSRGIDLVRIAAIYDSPLLAQKIANAIADNYVEESQKSGREKNEQSTEFLKTGAEDALAKLRGVEAELDKFRKERFAELPEVKKGTLEQRASLHTQQTARVLQLSAAKSRLTEIGKQMKDVPPRISAPALERAAGLPAPGAQGQALADPARQEAQLKQALDALLTNYTEEHPQVKALRKELAALAEQRKAGESPGERMIINPAFQQLVMDGLSVRQEIKGCEAALRGIQAEIAAREEDLRKVVNEEKRYTDLVRQQKELETTYTQYRSSLVAAETLQRATSGKYGTQVEMVAPALEPATPYRLQRLEIAGACLLGSLVVGVALMFVAEYSDPSFRSGHEAAAFLNLPVLAKISAIPEPENVRRRRRRIWVCVAVLVIVCTLLGGSLAVLETYSPDSFEKVMARVSGAADYLKALGRRISR